MQSEKWARKEMRGRGTCNRESERDREKGALILGDWAWPKAGGVSMPKWLLRIGEDGSSGTGGLSPNPKNIISILVRAQFSCRSFKKNHDRVRLPLFFFVTFL